MKLEMYAIRVTGTDLYMPAINTGRGYSLVEPQAGGGPRGPRLLHSRRAARNAAAAWKRGAWETVYKTEGDDFFNGPAFEVAVGAAPKQVPERAEVDLEIVRFGLLELSALPSKEAST